MKTIILLVFFVVAMFYIAWTQINIKPFKITFDSPYTAVGIFFLVLAILSFQYESRMKGKEEGRNEVIDMFKDVAKDETK